MLKKFIEAFAESIDKTKKGFNPDVESMEGAAVFYTCEYSGTVPFVEVRAISNYVEKRDKSKWKTGDAINNLCEILKDFIEEINKS